ncbi:hypothetical protein BSZ39_10840 [Bowdeniella nasicola]|uniref:Uncharacterized protein n=1 Tax=Bowdeniella nasicola TaxID=208480 RepID=A0A1Q5PZX6_9ACTO|nr:hypothetical protein [Bowdeniella nasicola]OKL53181.1 hypothetical protein BSZ39_10840 [Bowdeniella nasicola]
MRPKSKARVAAASAAVTAAYQLLQKYGPALYEYYRSNPEMLDQAKQFVARARSAASGMAGSGAASLPSITERLDLLRRQLDDLAGEDASEADREFARSQRAHLGAVEKSLHTLPVMADKQRKKNLRRISRSLDASAEQIVSHLLGEDIADADADAAARQPRRRPRLPKSTFRSGGNRN